MSKIMGASYQCAVCKYYFTERISPKESIISLKQNNRRVRGSLCPTCQKDFENFLNAPKKDLSKEAYLDVLNRVSSSPVHG